MFYDDEVKTLSQDYFLTNYERDLLALTIEELVRKNPDKTTDELKDEVEKMRAGQAVFEKSGH